MSLRMSNSVIVTPCVEFWLYKQNEIHQHHLTMTQTPVCSGWSND
ncbi:hypothetical protein LCGC14_0369180 [marine sediment metagenome]|uniref:Uncharacterized protein n=1 Tax=marine sediment metagenome TaxID=412755 RepID=A0A0F9TNQ5_9ZZZZ